MSLTKEIHEQLVQGTLDFCDLHGLEFREFIRSRLSGDYPEGAAQEWTDMVVSISPPSRRVNGEWTSDVRKFLKFYYDQSENMVVPRTSEGDWTDEGWNKASNEIYGYKFIRARKRVDELIGRFNTLPKEPPNSVKNKFVHPSHGYALNTLESESGSDNGLVCMSLLGFIQRYGEELEDYYDEDFGCGVLEEIAEGDSMILCLVDRGIIRSILNS